MTFSIGKVARKVNFSLQHAPAVIIHMFERTSNTLARSVQPKPNLIAVYNRKLLQLICIELGRRGVASIESEVAMTWLRKDHMQIENEGFKLESYWTPTLKIGSEEWDVRLDCKDVGGDTFVHLKRGLCNRSGFARLIYEAFRKNN